MSTSTPGSIPDDHGSVRVHWGSSAQLEFAVSHVFLPAHRGYTIPDDSVEDNNSLAHAVCAAAHEYSEIVDDTLKPQWRSITKMLDSLQVFLRLPWHLSDGHIISHLHGMQSGDVLMFLNQAQDAAITFTKQDHCTVYEVLKKFRGSQPTSEGFYAECAIEIPQEVFHNQYFQSELADFLFHLEGFPRHRDSSEDIATMPIGLLTSILRGVGRTTEDPLFDKCANSHYRCSFRRRSFLWLLIKVAMQMSLRGDFGGICYKAFVLCFMCSLARSAMDANLSCHLLHAISTKILRRLRKLGSSGPNWLHNIVIKTSVSLREVLEARWKEVKAAQLPSSLWGLSKLDLDQDTKLSLMQSGRYFRNSIRRPDSQPLRFPFYPKHLLGSLNDILSSNGSFFKEAYRVDPCVALYDVEQAIQHEIDTWVACVADVDWACIQLAILLGEYLPSAGDTYKGNPKHLSIMLLTAIELWVALDKLAVRVVPMLIDYAPSVPTQFLHWSIIHATMLHRLRRAQQYLSARTSQSLPGRSALSDQFIRNMFPVQYHAKPPYIVNSPAFWHLIEKYEHSSSHAALELQCSLSLHIWHSGTSCLLHSLREMAHDYFACRHPSSDRLDQYSNAASHTSNDIISSQADCPNDLSLHEFITFGHLRSGGSLQWMSILQELRSRTLNFRRHDVYLLFAQAASQVGPLDPNTAEWEWHEELQEPSFCYALLDELESLLVDVAVYSLNGVMMGIISLLLTRLLASSPCQDVSERSVGLLRLVRRKTFHWVQEMSYNLMMMSTTTERSGLLRDMAATCRSTFDVGPNMVHKVLCSAEDIDALLFCAILMRVNSPVDPQSISEYSRFLLQRDRRLSLSLESALRNIILADVSNQGIDLAVRRVWFGYRPGPHRWQALPRPNSHWLACESAVGESRRTQMVHLDLLDGVLLIDGGAIDALPCKIREYETYKQIFGDQHFIVIPSDLPGMDFCSLTMISEHRVHFALQDGILVIQAQYKDTTDILVLIPREKLPGGLPTRFIDGHVHWLNLSTSIIEIRPHSKLWEQSSKNWRIDCTTGQYRMYNGREWLVDNRSSNYETVLSRFRCLDAPENLIITAFPVNIQQSPRSQQLSVVLSRYGLSFFVNEDGELESRDFENMVYDENQCIGTLFGLENRLVLRSKVHLEELIQRCVIIPEGQFSHEQHNHHVRVTIVPEAIPTHPVTYYVYQVDTELGCLTGYASWRSRLYLASLHAETSVDWMPDPLTGRTGIEEALCLLRSAGCRSIMALDTRHTEAKLPFSDDGMYPQIQFAMREIEYLINRERFLLDCKNGLPRRPDLDVIGVLRTAYLFPSDPVFGPMPTSESSPLERFARNNVANSRSSEQKDLAHTVALAVYHWLINTGNGVKRVDTPVTAPTWANADLIPRVACQDEHLLQNQLNCDTLPPSITEIEAFMQKFTETRQQCRLLFLLPIMLYTQEDPQPHFLAILVALAKQLPLKNPPSYDKCQPLYRYSPSEDTIRQCFADVGYHVPRHIVHKILGEWPSAETNPSVRVISRDDHLYDVKGLSRPFSPFISLQYGDVLAARRLDAELRTLFSGCYRNLKLKDDLTRRLTELDTKHYSLRVPGPNPVQSSHTLGLWPRHVKQSSGPSSVPRSPVPWQVTLDQLLHKRSPPNTSAPIPLQCCGLEGNRLTSSSGTHTLSQLLASFRMDGAVPLFQQYITRLHDSAHHVPEAPCTTYESMGRPSIEELRKHYVQCKLKYTGGLTELKEQLGPTEDPLDQALHRSGQWPPITPDTLFRCLASTSTIKLPDGWKKCLLSLALLLLEYQRARRLLQFALGNLEEDFSRELMNKGCDGWKAEDYPDWLLIQLNGNLLIRGVQADVATKMIFPSSGANTAMQVNMGEGKSSVILPISAATLADGNQIVRVIVSKTLTLQMFRLLVHRLGGLVNRPIYHLPFSRSLTGGYDKEQFKILRELLSECVQYRGILVLQPEHVLSLKLTSIEQQLPMNLCGNDRNSYLDSRGALLQLQKWFDSCARDILDESDEVLRPRFQLIYAIGPQQHLQGYPDRWTITQQVLRIVKDRAISLSRTLPDAIECERVPPESFPQIRIPRASDARRLLISLIAKDVVDGLLPGFSFRDIGNDQSLRDAVRDFISFKEVSPQMASMVEQYARRSSIWDGILLLRGFLACGVLLFALAEQRWRVDYGLCPNRTLLAVPYRSKDVPAPAAEFGYPDTIIVLTYLSYYYGGLTEEQLKASFKLLQEQEDASTVYSNWLRDHDPHSVPASIQDLRNVNIKSSEQWNKYLFPLFSRNQAAVNFYLSQIVFPKEAKEFPWKLAASSWNLVETRERPITGFSGTNDGQYLLPTSITQLNLDHQLGTNAKVLSHLLQPENNFYTLISDTNRERRTTFELLKLVVNQDPKIRVLLDVGAQILDLSNYHVAKAWLGLTTDSDGAVYFSEDDEMMVLTTDGTTRTLLSSPLAQHLDRCVVYLDDAHTRGTDLKFPSGSRAAVTLGPKVTKDRLVQGCMRMRKLGHGHSVMFFSPLEVDRNIRVVAAKEDLNTPVTTTDILRWAIHETWTDIQQQTPYWAQQGINHDSQYEAWSHFCSDGITQKLSRCSWNESARKLLADAWLQPELKSLADLYAPFQSKTVTASPSILSDHLSIQRRCISLGVVKLPEARMDEEQEREINREVEREQEVLRRPPNAEPASHSLNPDVVAFVRTGFLPLLRTGSAFHPIFTTLEGSSAATTNASVWSSFVLATSDFCKTIKPASHQGEMDQYLRPVQWVLSGKGHYDRVLVLLSPFEADRLMPEIRVSKYVHLHVYSPRISERMKPADDLIFYSIPPLPDNWVPPWDLIDQLNIFAGQPYLRDYASYLRLCRLLGIQSKDSRKNVCTTVRRHLVTAGVLKDIGNTFTDSPLSLVMKLLVIRRRGLPFAESHMGRILQGEQLTEKDFENVVWAKSSHNPIIHDTQTPQNIALAYHHTR